MRFNLVLLGLLCCLPTWATGASVPPRPPARTDALPDLLAHAKPVFDLTEVVETAAGPEALFQGPLWLSQNVLLAHSRMGDGFFDTPYRFDLRHQRLTPLPRLKAIITECKPADWDLSSDHRWILWCEGWNEPSYDFVATRIDGRRSVRWTVGRADCGGPVFWLPGTHQWVHLLLPDEERAVR
jgi:hypothetical protein